MKPSRTVVDIERFVFPGETSSLSDAEFEIALRCLDWVDAALKERSGLYAERGERFAVHLPGGNWEPTKAQNFELDKSVTNPETSFRLLLRRDRNVLAQLRLYSQAFSGYQLATLEFANRRPWIRKPLPPNFDEFVAMLVCLPDPHLQRWAGLVQRLPPGLSVPPPAKFGEMGWLIGNTIVNYDTWVYLHRIALLHESGILERLRQIAARRRPRVLEIGGGYGAFAYHVSKLVPQAQYSIIDLPESLAFSSIYLSVVDAGKEIDRPLLSTGVNGRADFCLCPNYLLEDLIAAAGPFDLVINTLSLAEMTEAQVNLYAGAIARSLAEGGEFFEQNAPSDRYGVSNLPRLLSAHFRVTRSCPSTLARELYPGPARIWSTG